MMMTMVMTKNHLEAAAIVSFLLSDWPLEEERTMMMMKKTTDDDEIQFPRQ
jgi:hypothetical protein